MATYNKLSAWNKRVLKQDRFQVFVKGADGIGDVVCESPVTVEMDRQGGPSKLVMRVVDDGETKIENGNTVMMLVDGKPFWHGYVFTAKEKKEPIIECTCYDQLRYLKNKDTYQYEDTTYSDLLKRICTDQGLILGEVEDTEYAIAGRVEEDKEYWSMLEVAHQYTVAYTGKLFVLYDDAGKICLKNIVNRKIKDPMWMVDADGTQDFDYQSSIDENTYNRIKIDLIDEERNEVRPIIVEDGESIGRWGLLQYYAQTTEKDNVEEKAQMLLKELNRETRKLKVNGVIGSPEVRGGSLVPVLLRFRNLAVNGWMVVERVKHIFEGDYHFVDLELLNKDFRPQTNPDGAFQNQRKSSSGSQGGGDSGPPVEGALGKFLQYVTAQEGGPYSQERRFDGAYHDCSSLILRGMRAAGLDTTGANMTTRTIANDSRFVEISKAQLRKGDILWKSGHVAVYMGNGRTFEAKDYGVPTGYAGNIGRFSRYYRIKGT